MGELVETILSRINIADTNELAKAVESWRGASGGAPLPDDPSRQKAWNLPIVERNWENMLRVADIRCVEPDCWPRHRERAGLGSMLCRFRRLGHFWTPRVLGLPLPLEWAPMFVTGGWTVGVCMVCPADTVFAAFKAIREVRSNPLKTEIQVVILSVNSYAMLIFLRNISLVGRS